MQINNHSKTSLMMDASSMYIVLLAIRMLSFMLSCFLLLTVSVQVRELSLLGHNGIHVLRRCHHVAVFLAAYCDVLVAVFRNIINCQVGLSQADDIALTVLLILLVDAHHFS